MSRHELEAFGLDAVIERALAEDVGAGDLTTEACIDTDTRGARVGGRAAAMVACGGPVFERVFRASTLPSWRPCVEEGARRGGGDAAGPCRGARAVHPDGRARRPELRAADDWHRHDGPRVCRRAAASGGAGPRTRITDTRKTTPGLRALERYAVRVGGGAQPPRQPRLGGAHQGQPHRGVRRRSRGHRARARARAPHTSRIECEVDSLEQLDAGARRRGGHRPARQHGRRDGGRGRAAREGKAITEASGGITLARIPALARLGVDVISVGALTHSVKAADVGLDFA